MRALTKRYYWAQFGKTIYVVFLNLNRTVTRIGIIDKLIPDDNLKEIKVEKGRERRQR